MPDYPSNMKKKKLKRNKMLKVKVKLKKKMIQNPKPQWEARCSNLAKDLDNPKLIKRKLRIRAFRLTKKMLKKGIKKENNNKKKK